MNAKPKKKEIIEIEEIEIIEIEMNEYMILFGDVCDC